MYKTKRKIIKDWKNKISRKEFEPLYKSEYPDSFQDVLNNKAYNNIEHEFRKWCENSNSSDYFSGDDYKNGKVTKEIEDAYKKFLQICRKKEYQPQKEKFWNKTKMSIYYNCGADIRYNVDNSDEEIKQDIIRCLEKALIIDVDWNKFVLILSAITNLASVMVSIILAIKS